MSGRILIADSVAGQRIVLKARLAPHAYEILQAASGREIRAIARTAPPDLILLPERLEDEDGIALCRWLREDPATRSLPIILRLQQSNCRARIRALEAGADAVVDPASEPALLNARIRNLLRRSASEADLPGAAPDSPGTPPGFAEGPMPFRAQGSIALVVPRGVDGAAWQAQLAPRLRGPVRVIPEQAALALLTRAASPADAILVAENTAEPDNTLRLIAELRSRRQTLRAALLLVQDRPATDRAVTALDIGISDLVETGFDAEEIALRLRRALARKAREDRVREALRDGMRLALTDPLTGLFNRRYAMARLDHICAETPRGDGFAVMAIDLDRFKPINDRWGHAAGDAVLVEVGHRMSRCLRQGDLLARIGGEEFLAVVRDCSHEAAIHAADRIRRAVGDRPVALPSGAAQLNVTTSIGMVICDGGCLEPAATLLDRADRALYAAKADGRNQVALGSAAAA